MKIDELKSKSELGRIIVSRGVIAQIPREEGDLALQRHSSGDWGDVLEEHAELCNQAIQNGKWIISSYKSQDGTEFSITTDAVGRDGHRAKTTVSLPVEASSVELLKST